MVALAEIRNDGVWAFTKEGFVPDFVTELANKVEPTKTVLMHTGCPARQEVWRAMFGDRLVDVGNLAKEVDARELTAMEYSLWLMDHPDAYANPALYSTLSNLSKPIGRPWKMAKGNLVISQDTINVVPIKWPIDYDNPMGRANIPFGIMEKPTSNDVAVADISFLVSGAPFFVTTSAHIAEVLDATEDGWITRLGRVGMGMSAYPVRFNIPKDLRSTVVMAVMAARANGELKPTPGVVSSMSYIMAPFLETVVYDDLSQYGVSLREMMGFRNNGGFWSRFPKSENEWQSIFSLHDMGENQAKLATLIERALSGGDVPSIYTALDMYKNWMDVNEETRMQLGMMAHDVFGMIYPDQGNRRDFIVDM